MKRIISDCFDLSSERLYDGEQLLKVVRESGEYTDLSNDADDLDRYAAVYDWDEELDEGELVGYVQL